MSKTALTLGALGTAVGVAGLVVGLTALMRPVPSAPPPSATATSTTSVAAPSQNNSRAAAAEACAGFRNLKSGVGIARAAFIDRVDRANDWESPQSLGTQGYYFSAVGSELDYLDARVGLDAPKPIISTIADLRRSLTAVVDADLRRQPASVSNQLVDEYSEALDAVESACKAAGVG